MTTLIVVALALVPFTVWYMYRSRNTTYILAENFDITMDDAKELVDKLENIKPRM